MSTQPQWLCPFFSGRVRTQTQTLNLLRNFRSEFAHFFQHGKRLVDEVEVPLERPSDPPVTFEDCLQVKSKTHVLKTA
jgi:hypothetical protein